jgi:hypothetical protein
MWVNFNKWGNASAGQGLLFTYGPTYAQGMAQNGTTNALYTRVSGNTITPNALGATNEWHLVTCSITSDPGSSSTDIWLDKTKVRTLSGLTPATLVDDQWKVGWYDGSTAWTLNGKVGPVMMWSNNLTGADVTNLFDIGRNH